MSIYEKVNEEQKKMIIKFGEIIYLYLNFEQKSEDDIIKMFTSDVDLKKEIQKAFESGESISELKLNHLKKENEILELNYNNYKINLEEKFNSKILELEQNIKDKSNTINDLIINNQSSYEKGLNEGKQYNQLILNERDKLLDEKEKLIEVYKPRQYENMKEKGDYVENIISDELVRNINKLSYVIDTSDVKGSGDKIIVFPNYKLMVECKNKTTIKKSDIEQFKDHYTTDFKENKYNASIFISYNCEYILGKGSFKIEEYSNNIIGYLGLQTDMSDKSKQEIIKYYLSIIDDIYTNKYIEIKKNKTFEDYLVKCIININDDILSIEKHELPLIENINNKYKTKKLKLIELINDFEKYDIPIPLEIQYINSTNDIFIKKIVELMDDDYIIIKSNWKKKIIEDLKLNEFYKKFINKKGITRDKLLKRFNEIKQKNICF